MTKSPNPNLKHACGQCGQLFTNESDYLQHRCSVRPIPLAVAPKLSESDILAAVNASRRDKKDRG